MPGLDLVMAGIRGFLREAAGGRFLGMLRDALGGSTRARGG